VARNFLFWKRGFRLQNLRQQSESKFIVFYQKDMDLSAGNQSRIRGIGQNLQVFEKIKENSLSELIGVFMDEVWNSGSGGLTLQPTSLNFAQ